MLRANLGTAQNSANVNNLGDMFGGTAQTYRNMQDAAERRPNDLPPTTRECPFCVSIISVKAKRCPQCTSEV